MRNKEKRWKAFGGFMLFALMGTLACTKKSIPGEVIEEEEQFQNIEELEAHEPIPYQIPLEEIGKKIEYLEKRARLWNTWRWEYWGLGPLPEQGVVNMSLYALEGNKIAFLPEGRGNTEIQLGDRTCEVYEEEEGYLFYIIKDWTVEEQGVPLNDLESSIIQYCSVREERREKKEEEEDRQNYDGEYFLQDLVWLGEVEVNLDREEAFKMPPIEIEENEYVQVVLNHIVERAKEEERYGSYDIYIDEWRRIGTLKNGHETDCWMNFAIVGEGLREYKSFVLRDDGYIRLYLTMGDILFRSSRGSRNEKELVAGAMKNARGVVHLDITKETEIPVAGKSVYKEEEGTYPDLSIEELLELLEYAWSYGEWFGINELGYKNGRLRNLKGKEVIFFQSEDEDKHLYFCLADEKDIYYTLRWNQEREKGGQLRTGLITSYEGDEKERGLELGRGRIEGRELPELEVGNIEEDEYVLAMEGYIKDLLLKNEKKGEYELYYGEYEELKEGKVCLSGAITGEKEYYVRCLIVKYGEGKYHFWPVGFGLNGSLEECEAEKHHMNKVSIERTKQLERHKRKIAIEE